MNDKCHVTNDRLANKGTGGRMDRRTQPLIEERCRTKNAILNMIFSICLREKVLETLITAVSILLFCFHILFYCNAELQFVAGGWALSRGVQYALI